MSDEPMDPEIAALAEQLDAQRPRPSNRLRRRVHGVLTTALLQRALRRRSVWLVASGSLVMVVAAVLATATPN
ncbi:MAG: hypothetical protein ITG02_07580 [Patulibacter sp.]|nr:hypothetical protein [Patulibacter sp.]